MKVEVAVLDSPPLTVLVVSMDVKQHLKKKHLPRELSSCVKKVDVPSSQSIIVHTVSVDVK